jgi:tubulin gamma
MLGFEEGEKV